MATAARPIPAGSPAIIVNRPKWLEVLPANLRNNAKDYFAYTVNFLPLAASGTQSLGINIAADSYFVITHATRIVTDTGNTTFLALAPQLVTLVDTGAGRQLSDGSVHMESLFGDAQNPAEWAWPKLMAPSSTLTVTLQNLEATARNVRLAFHGFKVFGFTG